VRETVNLKSTNLAYLMVIFYISSEYWKGTWLNQFQLVVTRSHFLVLLLLFTK